MAKKAGRNLGILRRVSKHLPIIINEDKEMLFNCNSAPRAFFFLPTIICNNAIVTQNSANASVHPVTYYYYKNKGDTNDLKEVMECAVSVSCGKWFHVDAELGTKDD